jgi:adenylyltransferase/sulfurtransferase
MIAPDVLRQIAAHARSTYPAECCGLLLQDRSGGIAFRPIANIAGSAEAQPTSSRTGRDGYVMDPNALLKALEETESAGGQLWGIVHSHPDVGAYFSREDRDMALGGGDEPLWPGVRYLVVSVRGGKVDAARVYSWDPSRRDFSEKELIIE